MEKQRRTRRCARLGHDHDDDCRLGSRLDRNRGPKAPSHVERRSVIRRRLNSAEKGSAVVEFTLILMILIPLVLGLMQVALVLHVRNTMTSAVSEGARTAAREGAAPAAGAAAARHMIAQTIAAHYASNVAAYSTVVAGSPGVEVTAQARVPALGLFGPSVEIRVRGRAIKESIQ